MDSSLIDALRRCLDELEQVHSEAPYTTTGAAGIVQVTIGLVLDYAEGKSLVLTEKLDALIDDVAVHGAREALRIFYGKTDRNRASRRYATRRERIAAEMRVISDRIAHLTDVHTVMSRDLDSAW